MTEFLASQAVQTCSKVAFHGSTISAPRVIRLASPSKKATSKPRSPCLASAAPEKVAPAAVVPALKEWAATIEALRNGHQTILIRKGGLKDKGPFALASSSFILYPTKFHATPGMLKPHAAKEYARFLVPTEGAGPAEEVASLGVLALVTGVWSTADRTLLARLDDLHVWSQEFLEARMSWHEERPLTVLELRALLLPQPVQIPVLAEYGGCKSWLDLPVRDSLPENYLSLPPAMSDDQFEKAQIQLRQILGAPILKPLHG